VIFLPLTIALAVLFLQPVKGVIVAWQWAQRMHGFGNAAGATGMPAPQANSTHTPP
jgi:hypothetical protein